MSDRDETAGTAGACEALRFARTHSPDEVACELAAADQDWDRTPLSVPTYLVAYLFGYRTTLQGWLRTSSSVLTPAGTSAKAVWCDR
jgi:hypothetical protein